MSFREHFKLESVKKTLKKWIQFFLNPHLLLCFFLGWMITNGWSYLMLGLGIAFHVTWMQIVATAYLSLLWLPFTPEKILTVLLAIFLLKRFFPKDEKTLGLLKEEYQKAKDAFHKQKSEHAEKKKERAKKKAEKKEKKRTKGK